LTNQTDGSYPSRPLDAGPGGGKAGADIFSGDGIEAGPPDILDRLCMYSYGAPTKRDQEGLVKVKAKEKTPG